MIITFFSIKIQKGKISIPQKTKDDLFKLFKENQNIDYKKYSKQFNLPLIQVKKLYQKYLNIQKAEQTKYKQDPTKLTQNERQMISNYLKEHQNANLQEIQQLIPNKTITSSIIKSIKHPIWSEEDDNKLQDLFNQFKNQKSLNWYQEQFKPKQKMFVQSQLTFITRNDRKLMPKREYFWTQEKINMVKELKSIDDIDNLLDKLQLNKQQYHQEFVQKYKQLEQQKTKQLKYNISKILSK